jgi:hypothetical protein
MPPWEEKRRCRSLAQCGSGRLGEDRHTVRVDGGCGRGPNRRLVIVPEHTRDLGGFMDLKSLQRKAKQLIDRRGGTDSLKADAEELKDIAKGPGSVADKRSELARP